MESFRREIFDQMGRLFYAVATDQQVTPLEFGRLKMLLRKDWLGEWDRRLQDGITEESHLIVLAMDTLQTQGASAPDAFNCFISFYRNHQQFFSEELKAKIVCAARDITEIFSTGGHQNNHIVKLELLFNDSSLIT